MDKQAAFRTMAALALILALASSLPAAGLRFEKAEYAARRARLLEKIPDGVAVIWGAQTPGNYYPTAQANDFNYLTGVELGNAVLLLDGASKTATLFLTATEDQARQEGVSADLVKNPRDFTGLDRVAPFESFSFVLAALAGRSKVLYTPFKPEELFREVSTEKFSIFQRDMTLNPWDGRLTRELQFVKILRERYPSLDVRDLLPAHLGTAGDQIAGRDRASAPGRPDRRQGPYRDDQDHPAGDAGVRAVGRLELHLRERRGPGKRLRRHHLLRREPPLSSTTTSTTGCSRTAIFSSSTPVPTWTTTTSTSRRPSRPTGSFTPRQKEVYEASLAVHETSMKVYRPGLTAEQCRKEVDEILVKQGFDLNKDYFQRMRGGFGHYVGMATHDVGGEPQVLKPGMVFANEPLAVFAAENLGVRVEDTVLITETGCENPDRRHPPDRQGDRGADEEGRDGRRS